jgi:uncharacterized protein YjbK
VKLICCDNAGEYQQELQVLCAKYGIQLKYTALNTPQQDGLVERQFTADLSRANAMMESADLPISMRNMLREEAIMQTPYE